jgi:hypothetical protein
VGRRRQPRLQHPTVAAWVPINESWGVPNLPDNPAERHYVQALYHLTHTLDPNGLLNADRRPKIPIDWIAAATRGVTRVDDAGSQWKETHMTAGVIGDGDVVAARSGDDSPGR